MNRQEYLDLFLIVGAAIYAVSPAATIPGALVWFFVLASAQASRLLQPKQSVEVRYDEEALAAIRSELEAVKQLLHLTDSLAHEVSDLKKKMSGVQLQKAFGK